jgi:hypothetical protein
MFTNLDLQNSLYLRVLRAFVVFLPNKDQIRGPYTYSAGNSTGIFFQSPVFAIQAQGSLKKYLFSNLTRDHL